MPPRIILTADNTPTLYVPELNEHYGSVNGALNESKHVFIHAGLHAVTSDQISLLEVGFGTGLNAILTILDPFIVNKTIHYETLEKFPLDKNTINELSAYYPFNNNLFNTIHNTPWEIEYPINDHFYLKKRCIDLLNFSPDKKFNLIYFDAFAPDKQPELWTEEIFSLLYDACLPDAILVTYSSKGTVKQALRNAQFNLTRLKGPLGKRHMLKAQK
jgi:tRNA U34 5-methylaminomethyl-2-thiouridine-forming methyltransferase MnmC